MLTAIFNALRGYTASFDIYERRIIAAVADKLDPEQRTRLERRAAAINKVHRIDGGREVLGYQVERRRIVFPEATRLTAGNDVEILAQFVVRARTSMSSLSGKLIMYRGNFSMIQFDQNTEHAECEDVIAVHVDVAASLASAD